MTIQWLAENESSAVPRIEYRKSGEKDYQAVEGSVEPFPRTLWFRCRVELTNLEPGTLYRFRIPNGEKRSFRTAPARLIDPLVFASGGDAGVTPATERTHIEAARQNPLFVLIGGDLTYSNGERAEHEITFFQMTSKLLVSPDGCMIPLVACIGNHEVQGAYNQKRERAPFFYNLFGGLFSGAGYAALDFGDYLSLLLLDTNHTTPIEGAQTEWLEAALQERAAVPHVFGVQHVPTYPSHRSESTGKGSREHWAPLWEKYNVPVVLEHHDHTYKRTRPLTAGKVDPDGGVTYLGDGAWGQLRTPRTPQERPYLRTAQARTHFILTQLEVADRSHVAIDSTGRVLDSIGTRRRST
jgi:hypothetical protein